MIKDIFVGQILVQGNSHLWFLPTLFIIFLFIYLLEKTIRETSLKLFILFALSFISVKIPVLIIRYVFEYALWFYLGYCFEKHRVRLNGKQDTLAVGLISGVLVFALSELLQHLIPEYPGIDFFDIIDRSTTYLLGLSGCIASYNISFAISRTKAIEYNLTKTVRTNSLGLYLYSDTLNYIILNVAVGMFGSTIFTDDIRSALLCISRIVFPFGVALLISTLLKKTKAKYVC